MDIFRRPSIAPIGRRIAPLPSAAAQIGTGAIDSAAGVATTGTLTGASTARASFGVAAGVGTASALVGSGSGSAITAAAGLATTAELAGRSTARAAFGTAVGIATASVLASTATPTRFVALTLAARPSYQVKVRPTYTV